MRICIVGKFPPIQGGVSARTYWTAHGFAMRGHEVHVVTNAKEATSPFRMHMRTEDWAHCATAYDTGSVTVHWTDTVDRSQAYLPMASPFVTKLATTAARAHSEHPFDVIYSHYLEPYGVAAHLAAEMTGVPHVTRMAGSDAGRLWHHPQFELLYDHVLRAAAAVVAVGTVAERAAQRGVAPDRIVRGGGFVVPEDLYTPEGPALDIPLLRPKPTADPELGPCIWGGFAADRPYFGLYGKLGERKGSFALLAAMHRLKADGLGVGLVALAHGRAKGQGDFRARAEELGLADNILQVPFLPHWRIPEFLRGCLAVCCLEQGFPITFHAPVIPREVLLCGTCLVGSTEVIRKLPSHERLPHGYGCIAIEDVNDIDALSEALAAIARNPRAAQAIGARGARFARELQAAMPGLEGLEQVLEAAAGRRKMPVTAGLHGNRAGTGSIEERFPLTRIVAASAGGISGSADDGARPIDLAEAARILDGLESRIRNGHASLRPLAAAVRIEIAMVAAENDETSSPTAGDPLFRLQTRQWPADGDGLLELIPLRDPWLRIIEFDHDVSGFLGARSAADFPDVMMPGPSYIVVFVRSSGRRRDPLLVDAVTGRILMLSDGTRTVAAVARDSAPQADASADATNLGWIEKLFVAGLIWLRDEFLGDGIEASPNRPDPGPPHHRRPIMAPGGSPGMGLRVRLLAASS